MQHTIVMGVTMPALALDLETLLLGVVQSREAPWSSTVEAGVAVGGWRGRLG